MEYVPRVNVVVKCLTWFGTVLSLSLLHLKVKDECVECTVLPSFLDLQ